MYITDPKHGKVDLMVSKPGSANFTEMQINRALSDSDTVLHITYSRLMKQNVGIQDIRTVIASFVIADRKICGVNSRLLYNVATDYDVSNGVHFSYVRNILVANDQKHIDRAHRNEEDTRIIRGLFYERWLFVEKMLSDLRRERIRLRRSNPRSSAKRGSTDDNLIDQAISHMVTKVNAVMNQILYWGEDRIYSFSEK